MCGRLSVEDRRFQLVDVEEPRIADGKVVVEVIVGEIPCLALLDTGAVRSVISERLSLRQADGEKDPADPEADGDAEAEAEATVQRVTLGSDEFQMTRLPVDRNVAANISRQIKIEVSLVLGMDFVRSFERVALDYANHELALLKPARAR